MDPGFLIYDSQFGWQMAPNWKGRHRHYDFDVHYTTNFSGLRGPWPEPTPGRPRYAFLGDSFTFGLGVNDDETFVQRLSKAEPFNVYLNAGVAGYSTDQEYLYLKQRILEWRLNGVALVVYLANDLLDNTLQFPLQAEMGKPLFVLESQKLRLTNVPVPVRPKPPEEHHRTLGTMILGEAAAREQSASWRSQWQLAQRLGVEARPSDETLARIPDRLSSAVDLFLSVTQEMRRVCEQNQVTLKLILMPGRSYVELPDSVSAGFQDYMRQTILARQSSMGVPVLDLATALREQYRQNGKRLFHPNEGHLTALGHEVVSQLLRDTIINK